MTNKMAGNSCNSINTESNLPSLSIIKHADAPPICHSIFKNLNFFLMNLKDDHFERSQYKSVLFYKSIKHFLYY